MQETLEEVLEISSVVENLSNKQRPQSLGLVPRIVGRTTLPRIFLEEDPMLLKVSIRGRRKVSGLEPQHMACGGRVSYGP